MKIDSWSPEQYDKFKDERSAPFYDLMALLTPSQGARVVDLGCGTGELSLELHRHLHASQTLGLDTSDEMLLRAVEFTQSGIEFHKENIQFWHSKNEFDVVFSNAALQWCPNHPALFHKIKEALRPGGQLAVQMPMNHDYITHLIAHQMSHEEPWSSLLGVEKFEKNKIMLSVDEYSNLLSDLGFKKQNVFLKSYEHELESREQVLEWVKGSLLTHFQSRMKEKDYEHFVSAFRKRLFAELPDQKPFFYPFKRIFIWANLGPASN
jgi:trans-aconitate 2-methyltransferase